MADTPKELPDGFSYSQMSVREIVERRNFVAELINRSQMPTDAATVSALGLLFVEACKGNRGLIAQNMEMLLEAFSIVEEEQQRLVAPSNDKIH